MPVTHTSPRVGSVPVDSQTENEVVELPPGAEVLDGPIARVTHDGSRALKVFQPGYEPQVEVEVEHPRIGKCRFAGRTPDGAYVVESRFHDAGSLAAKVSSESKRSWHEALRLAIRLAGAVEALHRAGIAHGGIKPTNVLFADSGDDILLVDTGHGAWVAAAAGTRTGEIGFFAPEILEGNEPDVASDVYGLGATVHFALSGESPFAPEDGETLMRTMRRIATEDPADLRTLRVPEAFAAALEKAMAKDPADRFASALEFGKALQAVERDQGHSPATPLDLADDPAETVAGGHDAAPVEPAGTPPTRKRSSAKAWVLGSLALVAALALGVLTVLAVASTRHDADAPAATQAPPTAASTPAPTTSTPPSDLELGDLGADRSVFPDIAGYYLVDLGKDSSVTNPDLEGAMFQSSYVAGIKKGDGQGPDVGVLLSLVLQPEYEDDPKALAAVIAAFAPDAPDAESVEIAGVPLVEVTTADSQVLFAWQDQTGLVANVLRGSDRAQLEAFLSTPGVLNPQ